MPRSGDHELFRARLAAERRDLEAASSASSAERAPAELDQQSVGRLSRLDAIQVQAMAVETERRRRLRLERIGAALARLDAGEFGWCAACGEAIPPARLELDPTVPTCIACARRAEG